VQSNPDIAYISIHQFPFYPGTGSQMERGDFNNVLNIPVPSGFGSTEYKQIFHDQVFPFIQNFHPDLLIISAGFDAHQNDPLAGINLGAEDFAYMTKRWQEIQPNLLLGLEGGYNLEALGDCVIKVCVKLM
jgi:acetoin utilization deacetylase AcuC-like enzyme